ncbi:MAG: DUF2911 domain-containing protein [Tunicatimonas sp.]
MKKMTQSRFTALLFSAFVLFALPSNAQDDKSKRASPPAEVSGTVEGTDITINYSRPSVKGRTIFGELEPYGEVWRTGANEATTIEVSTDVEVEGQPLPAGKYALFTIPAEDDWTVVFNKVTDQWGAYDYDEAEDALRVEVTPEETEETTEQLTFEIGDDGEVTMMWANTAVSFGVANAGQASSN